MLPSSVKVLVIDDDEDDYFIVKQLLKSIISPRYELNWAANSDDAKIEIETGNYDIYLVDYWLGADVGLELFESPESQEIPFILLTGLGDQAIDIAALNAGAADYLVKGEIDANTLERAIRYAISHHKILQELKDSLARYEELGVAIRNVSTGVVIADAQTQDMPIVYINPAFTKITGYTEAEVIGKNCRFLQGGGTNQDTLELLRAAIRNQQPFSGVLLNYRKDGTTFWNELKLNPIFDSKNNLTRYVGLQTDITERISTEEQLLHNALYDKLTDLPNRTLFLDRLEQVLSYAKRNPDYNFSVLFLDIDRFKMINDSFGHPVGDELLMAVSLRLMNCIRAEDTISRFGGDEFVILLPNTPGLNNAITVANRIHEEIKQSFHLTTQDLTISVSIGIALSQSNYELAEDIIRDADIAMYRAKSMGRAQYAIFDTTMYKEIATVQQIEADLRQAIIKQELEVYYQPIIEIAVLRLAGFEALVRWNHPQRGLVPPNDFIPIAEETGLIVEIDQWVLEQASHQMRAWLEKFDFVEPVQVCVNMSTRKLHQSNFTEVVINTLNAADLAPHYLKLEITESSIMEDINTTTENLKRLVDYGVLTATDDFGTGYSSLSYLHRLPINSLKVDRSFITNIDTSHTDLEMARLITLLGHNMNMNVIAEGVETEAQLNVLRSINCDFAQGYFFSKPLPVTQIEQFIENYLTLSHPSNP